MSRQGVPLPAALEVLLMVLLFDLFKEAGLRLPGKHSL
nr:spore germination protein [Brevibacillus centrosporus]